MPDAEGNPADEAEARAILEGPAGTELMKAASNYVAPFFWALTEGNNTRILHNGSAFFLRVEGPTFLVTAAHVVRGYEKDRETYGNAISAQIGEIGFDPLKHLFAIDDDLDLATIKVPDTLPDRLSKWPYQRQARFWPPPPPTVGRGFFFMGFPGIYRTEPDSNSVDFGMYGGLSTATAVGESHVASLLDRDYAEPLRGLQPPPLSADLGGMSGAPGWTLTQVGWRLGGVLVQYGQDSELFYFRRADSLRPDGSIG